MVTIPTCVGGGTNALAGALLQALVAANRVISASANALRRVGELGM
jgi:hypothetical protein